MATALAPAGCGSDNPSGPGPAIPVDPPFLFESVVLESSAFRDAADAGDGSFVADLSAETLVADRAFNELEVEYVTATSCDEDFRVWNGREFRWVPVAFAPDSTLGCLTVLTTQSQLLGDRGLVPDDFVDGRGTVRFQGPARARVHRLHEGYRGVIPDTEGRVFDYDGIAVDGETYWMTSNREDRIYIVRRDGTVIWEMPAPAPFPMALAIDQEDVWLVDGTDRVFLLALDGGVRASFDLPTDFPGGIAVGDGSLWLAESGGPDLRLFRIDPELSVQGRTAIIEEIWDTPGGACRALEWVGGELVVLSDAVYLVDPGTALRIVDSYPLPVRDPQGAAWDGSALSLLCRGPAGLRPGPDRIVRFRLR